MDSSFKVTSDTSYKSADFDQPASLLAFFMYCF